MHQLSINYDQHQGSPTSWFWSTIILVRRDLVGVYHHSNGATILNWWLTSREYIKGNASETKLPGYYPNRSPHSSLWVGPGIWSTDRRDDVCATVKTPYVGHGHPTLNLRILHIESIHWHRYPGVDDHPPMRFTNPVLVTVVHVGAANCSESMDSPWKSKLDLLW